MEPENIRLDENSVCGKKNNINAQAWDGHLKKLFKRQRIEQIVPDVDGKLAGPEKLCETYDEDTRAIGSNITGKCEDVSAEFHEIVVAFDGALQKSIHCLNDAGSTGLEVLLESSTNPENVNETISSDKHENHSICGTSILFPVEKSVGLGSLEQKRWLCDGNVYEDMGTSSACEDKAVGSGIEDNIKKIQKKSNKRMKKLNQKQQEEIQMFYRIWEVKGEELKADHKLKSAIIQNMHGENLVKIDKLKLLNDNFAQTMAEDNLLKDTELKSLEAKQLAATNAERQRAVDEVKAFTGEIKFVNGANSLGCQSGNGPRCSQLSAIISSNSPVDVMPTSSIPAQTVCCSSPIEAPKDLVSINLQHITQVSSLERLSLIVVEQPNGLELSGDIDETVSAYSLTAGQKVSGGLQLKEMNREVRKEESCTAHNEVSEHIISLELSNAKKNGNGLTVGLNNLVENVRKEPDSTIFEDVPLSGQRVVREEKIPQSLVSAARQLENQNTSQVEVSTLESIDNVAPAQSNHEVLETEGCKHQYTVSAESAETEGSVQKSVSGTRENLEHVNHSDQGPPNRVTDQAVLCMGIEADHLLEPGHLQASLTPQDTAWDSNPSLLSEPLQDELERIKEETELLEKFHEDAMLKMKSDCQKKIEESAYQIRNEYEMNIKHAEAALALKKNELNSNQNIVLMNKMLAEAFRSKCLETRPSCRLDMQSGDPPILIEDLQSASSPESCTADVQVTQASQQVSPSQPTTLFPVEIQSSFAPVKRTTAPSRPLIIGALTPSEGSPRAGGGIRTTPPHLRHLKSVQASSKPFTHSSSMPLYKNLPQLLVQQQSSSNQSVSPPSQKNLHNFSRDLPRNVNNRPVNHPSAPLREDVHVPSAVETEIVCLSDDD